MSWLNNSLNQLKGTISNLAQEVLSEHEQNDENLQQQQEVVDSIRQLEILEESQRKIDELSNLCGNKDNEITLLRKQINDLQNKSSDTEHSSKSPINKDGGSDVLEDSWCWELDNVPSSGSSSGGGEMINIPLDSNIDSNNKINQQKLKKLQNDNRILLEKNQELEKENDNLNKNLDELDRQQNLAIENLLSSKQEIQTNYNKITKEYETEKISFMKKDKKLKKFENNLENLTKKFDNLQNAYSVYAEENLALKLKNDESDINFKEKLNENLLLKNLLEEKDKQLIELIEKVENDFGNERDEENAVLKRKLQLLTEQIEELENANLIGGSGDKKSINKKKNLTGDSSSSTSSSGKQSEDEFIVLEDENGISGHNWEQKYNELVSEKSKHEEKVIDLEKNITELETNIKLIEIENSNILEKYASTKQNDIKLTNQLDELKMKNNQLQEQFDLVNTKYLDYQDEHTELHKKLNEKILILEDQILDLQDKNFTLDNENQDQLLKIEKLSQSKLQESYNNLQADNKNLQDNIEQSNQKIHDMENDMKILVEKYENKIADLENEVKILTESRGNSPENETTTEIDEIKLENNNYKMKINELNDLMKICESNASDVESKLMMENVNLQKKLLDLEMLLKKQSLLETSQQSNNLTVDFNDLKNLFSIYVQTDLLSNEHNELEKSFKLIKDRIWNIDILEKNLKQMSDEISNLNDERTTLLHKIDTIKADNENYKIECDELSKNNGVLLDELDNYYKKLQTIPENNEESIVILEKQLEDCNDLNRSLEDEYKETSKKIDDLQNDKIELLTKIDNLEETITKLNSTSDQLNIQLDNMEIEKCNLIFEINEMKTDDKKSAIDSELSEHKLKITNLDMQLERLSKDHSDLVSAMQSQQNNLIETKKDNERLEKTLREKDLQLLTRNKDIDKYRQEFELLQSKVIEKSSTEDDKDNLMKIIDELKAEKNSLDLKLNNTLYENERIIEKLKEFEENFKDIQEKNDELLKENTKSNDLSNELNESVKSLCKEKEELIKTVQTKHYENLQYYAEIQRLGKDFECEKTKILEDKENCENCKELEKQIVSLQKSFENQINKLSEKYDEQSQVLVAEQSNLALLQQDKIELVEHNQNMVKDLDRLRKHLVDLEDSHTHETIEMQNIIDETKSKLNELQETVSKSNTAHTSASIRANQHAETIQAQYSLVTQQRDELAIKLSQAEDRESKNQAALVNLQCALEQFQRGKEKDIETVTNRIRKEIKLEKDKQESLQIEINNLKEQLNESNQGLLAASRISDQLESSKETILLLKDEIERLENTTYKLEQKLKVHESSQEDNIEKNLIKSLIIGYVVSNSQNDKLQILKMISSILNFNQNDNDKIGLNRNQTGWLGGILTPGAQNKDSLAEAFVNFLEKESQPRNNPIGMPNLLNIISDTSKNYTRNNERKLSTASTGSASGGYHSSSVQPILLNENILDEHFAPSRNSSSILKDILNDA